MVSVDGDADAAVAPGVRQGSSWLCLSTRTFQFLWEGSNVELC